MNITVLKATLGELFEMDSLGDKRSTLYLTGMWRNKVALSTLEGSPRGELSRTNIYDSYD